MARIRCPNCDTFHDLDGSLFAEGPRRVRCASCREVWTASEEGAEAVSAMAESASNMADGMASEMAAASDGQPDFDMIDADMAQLADKAGEAAPRIPVMDFDASAMSDLEETKEGDQIDEAAMLGMDPNGKDPSKKDASKKPMKAKMGAEAKSRMNAKSGSAMPARRPASMAVVLAAAGLGTLATLVIFREEVVRQLPQSAAVFDLVGLSINAIGIGISDVASRVVREDNRDTLEVTGTLTNVSGRPQRIPILRFSIHDKTGQDIYVWTASADQAELAPGASTSFRRRLASPPSEGHSVMVRFVAKDDIVAAIH